MKFINGHYVTVKQSNSGTVSHIMMMIGDGKIWISKTSRRILNASPQENDICEEGGMFTLS